MSAPCIRACGDARTSSLGGGGGGSFPAPWPHTEAYRLRKPCAPRARGQGSRVTGGWQPCGSEFQGFSVMGSWALALKPLDTGSWDHTATGARGVGPEGEVSGGCQGRRGTRGGGWGGGQRGRRSRWKESPGRETAERTEEAAAQGAQPPARSSAPKTVTGNGQWGVCGGAGEELCSQRDILELPSRPGSILASSFHFFLHLMRLNNVTR